MAMHKQQLAGTPAAGLLRLRTRIEKTTSSFVFGDGRVQYVDGRVVGDIFGRLMSRAGAEMTPEF